MHQVGGSSRATIEAYVRLNRSALRALFEEHLAECLTIQVGLLSDAFRYKALTAIAAGVKNAEDAS